MFDPVCSAEARLVARPAPAVQRAPPTRPYEDRSEAGAAAHRSPASGEAVRKADVLLQPHVGEPPAMRSASRSSVAGLVPGATTDAKASEARPIPVLRTDRHCSIERKTTGCATPHVFQEGASVLVRRCVDASTQAAGNQPARGNVRTRRARLLTASAFDGLIAYTALAGGWGCRERTRRVRNGARWVCRPGGAEGLRPCYAC